MDGDTPRANWHIAVAISDQLLQNQLAGRKERCSDMQKHDNADLEFMHENIAAALFKLSKMFSKGYLLTLVARHPTDPEKSTMVGDDTNIDALIHHIKCLDEKEEVSL